MTAQLILAAALAFGIALLTTPAGVSGAVLLVPVQVSVLGVPSPAVTATNLVYNLVATPGAVIRYWRSGAVDWSVARAACAGTLPGMVAGALLRVGPLASAARFRWVVSVVLGALAVSLTATTLRRGAQTPERRPQDRVIALAGAAAGLVGGVYGVGGGALLAPALTYLGMPVSRIAGAALVTTLATSALGVLVFEITAAVTGGDTIAPRWDVALALGVGGLLGGFAGARIAPRVPERGLRLLLAGAAAAAALIYLAAAVS